MKGRVPQEREHRPADTGATSPALTTGSCNSPDHKELLRLEAGGTAIALPSRQAIKETA